MASHHKAERFATREDLERAIRAAQTKRLESVIRKRVDNFEKRLIADAEKRLQLLLAMRPPRPKPLQANRQTKDARYYYKPFNHFRQVAYRQLRRLSGT